MTYMQPSNALNQQFNSTANYNQPVNAGFDGSNLNQSYQHVTLQRANQNSMQSQLYNNQNLYNSQSNGDISKYNSKL